MSSSSTLEQVEQELLSQKDYLILEESFEDASEKLEFLMKYQAVIEIRQASRQDKQKLIKQWAKKLDKSERTITRLINNVDKKGLAALARQKRSDDGRLMGSSQWKKNRQEEWESREEAIAYWTRYIQDTYNNGIKASRRISAHQVHVLLKSHAKLDLGLKKGEYPSHVFVYKILEPLTPDKKPRIRRPCQGPDIIIKCYCKHSKEEKIFEEIVVNRSNLVWQIDHTRLDNLLVNINGERVGSLNITSVVDTYSGCVMGFHLGFDAAGSHEVGLALRHAILPKQYSSEYNLRKEWEVYGLPEYLVTDNAKEFHSEHLKRIASQLDIKLRYRAYVEQGAAVERPFKNFKTEVAALLPGYKGGNLQERPHDAEKWACLTFEEYEQILVRFVVDHHLYHSYPRQEDKTRLMMWHEGLEEKPKIPNERELDICLLKESQPRNIEDRGTINCFGLIYQAGWVKDEEGLPYYSVKDNFLLPYLKQRVSVVLRYNPDNIIEVLVYTAEVDGQPSQYLGTVRVRDRREEQLSFKEWEIIKKKRREGKENLDQSSLLQERKDLMSFSNEKVAQKRKRSKPKTQELRREEQNRINQETRSSNVVPFPSKNTKAQELENVESLKEEDEVCYEQDTSAPGNLIEASPVLFVIPDLDDFFESNW
ncbi:DDE-type integrase/transposase/recombinase [Chroococcus sp. FPU101]|uniref:integrase catalytic domain-containing protein n=1 Tax=Chroococcus sp. FPU101 TaxID=1974212 RepID=UPI001A90C610|nr:DDE-type integrase/transposase/recombinase [Chroococcus sp. FPU101]GFE68754.1 Integrase, catalytic region [Chroococcus sp. FPU101]